MAATYSTERTPRDARTKRYGGFHADALVCELRRPTGDADTACLDLIEAIRREEPASINETARVVDRDVKNVHQELGRLARLGIVLFGEGGQRKRPVVWFDELVISLPFDPEAGDTAAAAP
nr:hypothetical protein [Halorubrum sp. F4]